MHVQSIKATVLESPDLKETLAPMNVVVLATGSERAVRLLKRGTAHFEYRHTPDPVEIDQVLLPMLESIRGTFPANAEQAPSLRRSHEN